MHFVHPWQRNDWIALELARVTARRLRENPTWVERGREQINRSRQAGRDFSAYREWEAIINSRSVEEIAMLLELDDEKGQRLRSSKPFIGSPFVTSTERKEIIARAFAE